MPFGAHETMETHEILNEKINLINHFSLYIQTCQNPNLRQIIERHRQTAIQAYDQLVAYTHNYNAANTHMQQPFTIQNFRPEQISYGLNNPASMTPQVSGRLSDPMIALAVLSCHKNSAKNHMAAALECADPNIRQMLIQGSLTCAQQAYEMFVFMNQDGLYQVPTMQDHTAKTFLHSYQPNQQVPMM